MYFVLLESQKIRTERFGKINLGLKKSLFCTLCFYHLHIYYVLPKMAASEIFARIETINRKRKAHKIGHKFSGHSLSLKKSKDSIG